MLTISSFFRRVCKAINEEIKITKSGWIVNLRKISLSQPPERWIFSYKLKTHIKRKLIWTLITMIIVSITKLRLYSHSLAINMGKWYKLLGDQKICRYCLRNNIENEMHILFDCDNHNTLRQDTFKR